MILPDVNVLIYAYREEAREHPAHSFWLNEVLAGEEQFGMSPQALASVVRIMTHRTTFGHLYSIDSVLAFCNALLRHPRCEVVLPGKGHWEIFTNLCRISGARGPAVQDAWFAALAIENGCEFITHDRDYARFPGLRWRPPF